MITSAYNNNSDDNNNNNNEIITIFTTANHAIGYLENLLRVCELF